MALYILLFSNFNMSIAQYKKMKAAKIWPNFGKNYIYVVAFNPIVLVNILNIIKESLPS